MLRFIITMLLAAIAPVATAQTGCAPLTLPWSENFDSYGSGENVVPTCWYTTHNYDLGPQPQLDSAQHLSGGASLMLYSGTHVSSHYSMAIGPEAPAALGEGHYVRFSFLAPSTAVALEVGICDDTSRQQRHFVPLDTLHALRSNQWQEVRLDLAAYSGTGRRLAFRLQRSLQAEACKCYIDDLHLETCGTTLPEVYHIGHDRMTVDWARYGEGPVRLEWNGGFRDNAVPPLTLTGLTPLTEYTLSVGCAGSHRQEVRATTLAAPSLTPAWREDFSSTQLPQGWYFPLACRPTVAQGAMALQATGEDTCLAVLPLADTTVAPLSLFLRMRGDVGTRVTVGVMEYALEAETFTAIDSLEANGQWQRWTVSLAPYGGAGRYLALKATGTGTVRVDEVRVARCMIDSVRLYDLTDGSVTIGWDTVVLSGSNPIRIEYGPTGFTPGNGTTVAATENPYVLEGLVSSTAYDLLVAPSCGDRIAAFDRHSIVTFAHEVAVPYCMNFEDIDALPQGWVCSQGTASVGGSHYEGSRGLRLEAQTLVALPRMGSSDSVVLEFYAYGSGMLEMGYMVNPYSAFVPIDTVRGSSSWQRRLSTIRIPDGHLLALRSTSAWAIDALSVHSDAVVAATTTAIGETSARIEWQTLRGDSVDVEYRAVASANADFAPGSGTSLRGLDSLTLEGLDADTYYAIHLRPSSDGSGCLHQTLHLQTAAGAVAVPYCENFDQLNDIPPSWRRHSDMGLYPIVSTERNHSPGKALHFSATATLHTVALLPDLATESDHLVLAFWTNATLRPEGAMLLVGRLDNIADIHSFTAIDTIRLTRTDTWEHQLVDLGTRHNGVALMLVGGSASETRLFVDDLCLEPCVAEGVRVAHVDSTSVAIHWESHGVAALDISLRSDDLTLRDTFATPPAVIHGLTPNAPYGLTFRAICDCGDPGGTHLSSYGTTGRTTTDQTASISINTHPVIVGTPYCNTFENYSTGHYPYNWANRVGAASVSDRNYHTGSHSLMVVDSSFMILPPMEQPASLTVSLQAYASNEAGLGEDAIVVGVMSNPDSIETFQPVDSMHLTRPGEWQRLWADLSRYDGAGLFVAIKVKANGGCMLFLDNLSVAPCGIGAATVDGQGAVEWEPLHGPIATAIEYGPQGFSPGSGRSDTTAESTFQLQDIVAGESYDIYLTPLCQGGTGCMPVMLTLGASAAPPYCEHFETAPILGMPTGWSIGRTHNGTPAITQGSNRSLMLKGHAGINNSSLSVLPLLASTDTLQLSLSLKAAGTHARLVVGHTASNADPNTFVPTDTLAPTADNAWVRGASVMSLTGGRRIAIGCYSINQNEAQMWIDSLAVTRALTPTLAATSARSMTIGGATGYVEYGPAGFAQGNGTLMQVGDEGLRLEGLTPDTEYWVYSREDSVTPTCMPPARIRMPNETTLPYCQGATTLGRLQLPEMSIDSLRHLHLYLTLTGPAEMVVGAMEQSDDWDHLVAIDTISVPVHVRRQVHVDLQSYDGRGRFVGLKSLTGNVSMSSLVATDCQWVSATMQADNRVLLSGHGTVEYGPAGYTPGSGTSVTVEGSLLLSLNDTTLYDFYPLCSGGTSACYAPQRWQTSLRVDLPYCVDLSSSLPMGWTVSDDSPEGTAVTVADNNVQMTVRPNQEVGLTLPIMDGNSVVMDLEASVSSAEVHLLAGGDTVSIIPGEWQTLRLRVSHDGRPQLAARGNGTVSLRNMSVATCALPRHITVGQPGNGNVELAWDTTDAESPFFVQCQLEGSNSSTTVRATSSPLLLHLLPDTTYHLFLLCDSAGASCQPPLTVTTLSNPLPLPYCTSFETTGATAPDDGWRPLTANGQRYLVMPQFNVASLQMLNVLCIVQLQYTSQHITLGTMTDAGNPATFDPLSTFTPDGSGNRRFFHSLANYYGNGRFLALRIEGNGWVRMEHLSVDTCAAYHFTMTETETDHIVLQWEQQGTPTVNVEYGPIGFAAGEGITVSATTSPLRINNLLPLTDYAFLVSYACDTNTCRITTVDTFLTFTPKGGTGCIDYTDLRASYVNCKYGTYNNPTAQTGVVDHGYLSAASRHTVHFDTTERDARTGGLLRTIPQGEEASVRLGNWTASGTSEAQAESITYALTVDTNQFNLLLLRYAAVLQDPEHDPSLQPRFRLQLLNQNNELIDSCSMADFIANPSLIENSGLSIDARKVWHQAANDVLWKDWTTVGIDLSPYGGQTIFIRLTTNDCGEGSHFGYAYFTLECASKRMSSQGCSDVPDNRFTVPSGFNYRWYSNLDTTTLSDSASIWVPSDNSKVYYCELSFIDNPSCNFTMSAFAGARYPLAIIDTLITAANCQYDLRLTNRSTISSDRVNPIGTGEGCETGVWLLPDTTSTATSLTLHFTDTGRVEIALVAGIANDQCLDTLRRTIHIVRPHPDAIIVARNSRCDNDTPDTLSIVNATSFVWDNGATGTRLVSPLADSTFRCFTVDTNGCHDTLTHTLHVHPSYDILTVDSVCNTAPTYQWFDTLLSLDNTSQSLALNRHFSTQRQCDSIHRLSLTLMPSHYIHHHDTLCHDSRLPFFDTLLQTTGDYLHTDSTFFGCDSMVTMHLVIIPRTYATDSIVTCDSLRWIDQRLYLHDTIGPLDTLPTSRGCDSIITLALTIHNSTYHLAQDTFCQGTRYLFEGHYLESGGYYADTFQTIQHCDSIMAIDLVQLLLPQIDILHDYDCDSLFHHVEVHASVPYLSWSSNPIDSTLDLHPQDSILTLNPSQPTTYTLYADYYETPHCPSTASITLSPQQKPKARLRVIPEALVLPKTTFDAYDISDEYQERAWYVDGILQGETSRHLSGQAQENADTLHIALVVGDGHCADTAIALVPLLRSALAVPNAFTPGLDNNNTFSLEGLGIIGAEIHIYNRNGNLVFHTTDYHQAWDGRNLSGEPCPTGSYVWRIRYQAETRPGAHHEETGTVLLIR